MSEIKKLEKKAAKAAKRLEEAKSQVEGTPLV